MLLRNLLQIIDQRNLMPSAAVLRPAMSGIPGLLLLYLLGVQWGFGQQVDTGNTFVSVFTEDS